LLSGFLTPVASIPVQLRWISRLIPATYYVDLVRDSLLRNAGWATSWLPVLVLADEKAVNPESEAEIQAVEHLAKDLLSELPEREAQVIKGLFGINHEAPQTLREVGETLNISHERVRQLRDQALRRIRRNKNKDVLREKYEGYLQALGT
jgi:RNA polymerase sigma factor (sigma-70 family)